MAGKRCQEGDGREKMSGPVLTPFLAFSRPLLGFSLRAIGQSTNGCLASSSTMATARAIPSLSLQEKNLDNPARLKSNRMEIGQPVP
jgi:hypothetical protein